MKSTVWNFYYAGILFGKIEENKEGLRVQMLDCETGKYGAEKPYEEAEEKFFHTLCSRYLSEFFRSKGECETAIRDSMERFETKPGEIYTKRGGNSYIQRSRKFPKDLFYENGEIYAVYMPARDSMAVLVRDGWEEKTVLAEWKNVFGDRPLCGVRFHGTFMVETRDKEYLATDVYLPVTSSPKVPVVLIRTPYNKREDAERYYPFVQRGYGVVVQDVRGREDSTGEWISHYYEVEDGDDTLNWIAAQEWSNQKIGMTGGSYLGSVQWAAAASGNPYLKAMLSSVTAGSAFVDLPRRGGCMASGSMAWAFMMSEKRMNENLMKQDNWEEILDYRPLETLPEKALGYPVPFISEQFRHTDMDEYWKMTNWRERYAGGPVPALIMSGWFDDNGMGTTEALDLVKGWPEGTWKAVLGGWKHSGNADYDIHGVYVGPQALRYDLDVLCMKWLEHFLKGVENGIEKTDTVEYYTLGENEWKTAGAWPPASTKEKVWYLGGGSDGCAAGSGTGCGQGTLSERMPEANSPSGTKDTYLYDPKNPAHHIIDMSENEIEVPENYTEEEYRADILSYTTPVLTEPITVTGDMDVKLYVSCDQPDTDFIVRVTDVDENGTSIKLADGMLCAKYRNSFEKPEFMKPGEVYEINIRTTKISNCFLPGHRIRVTVTSSAKNFIFPNSNTEKGFNSEEIRVANVTVHRSREYPSQIKMHVETERKNI